MKNKVKLKNFLLSLLILIFVLLLGFYIINVYEYRAYNKNINKKISFILNKIEEKYPDVTEDELVEILSSSDGEDRILNKYSFDIEKDTIIPNNEETYRRYLIVNVIFYIITIILMLIYFLKFNNKKDKEINQITKCIEEINRMNYALNLDEVSEDELSILKNEIYKTTIMLKEAAENSNKEKLQLKESLSDISHQLKTPLTSILIMLENIIDEPDMDHEVREAFVRDIKREVDSINFLVQSLLKLSKLDTNTIRFIVKEVFASKIVKEATQNVLMLGDLREVAITVNVKVDPLIKCDLKWQVEAISNILKNCIEHSERGGSVDVSVEDNKIYSQITIRDYGKGIDETDLPHIFDRFYKGKNANEDSVGIGLSLAKGIIEKDNGTINVNSDENGTEFSIKYYKLGGS